MANENSRDPTNPKLQSIPLTKIHDLPGIPLVRQPDKNYGGLVTSIQSGGVKEPVILRLREDGEYQLVTGYRRKRACELMKRQDIPALVYEMSLQEAIKYHGLANGKPTPPIPGKLVEPGTGGKKEEKPDIKETGKPTTGEKSKEVKPPESSKGPEPPEGEKKEAPPPKKENKPAAPVTGEKPKEVKPPEDSKGPELPEGEKKETPPPKKEDKPAASVTGEKPKEAKPSEVPKGPEPPEGEKKEVPPPKKEDKPTAPVTGEKPKEVKPPEGSKGPELPEGEKKETPVPKTEDKSAAPVPGEKPKEVKLPEGPKGPEPPAGEKKEAPISKTEGKPAAPVPGEKPKEATVTGPAAKGPAGTAISQVFDERLTPPDEKAKRDVPSPQENESFFILLHPAYLEKSKYNTISVDTRSEDYLELKKSIELNGVKDPVLARIGDEGTLEILSGQRRHLIATELNYPVPTIIQKISDADAKILVADGNLHRPHISMFDLSRSLRMKMEGMKQKAGRKKKGTVKAEELDSDEKLAQEMGMKVSKLNRIIRLSEATKDVCDRVDDNSLPLSIASAISFLKPENQDEVLHLSDLSYKLTTERIERMKKAEKAGKLDEKAMREILEDKDLAPKHTVPPPAPQPPAPPPTPPGSPPAPPPIPPSPDVKPEQTPGTPAVPKAPEPSTPGPAPSANPPAPESTIPPSGPTNPPEEKPPFKGEQERPEYTKVILAGDRLRKYFPDVSMTPREIEESVYDALEERRQRQLKAQQKDSIFKKNPMKK
ncbi:ParB N-terminal domain-containing protein [uncultured Oscillibacter sp.]|uniref:ParB N-terminal domain-containing protein n=1 Tax=uncultured Oscillibacter sp. TaxID=876091 RepID=UPI0026029B25|nr:ParB N-terminal domain-containing protein [uncultured Oscillibacter sp.]